MAYNLILDIEELSTFIQQVFPQADKYNWNIEALASGEITVSMNVLEADLRPGGTVSGPTMFALADITSYMLVLAHIGKVEHAVTTNLNINFLKKPKNSKLVAKTKLLKLGKRLAVCDISIYSFDQITLVAHANATYSIPQSI